MLLTWASSFGANAGLSFDLPLTDSGSGAVNTAVNSSGGSGTPTFTRATAAASKLSTGLWKLDVASGTARSHYLGANTAVGAYGGYLAEGAATQLLSAGTIRDMSGATWAKVTMTAALTSTGIDGTASSCSRVTATGANSTILQTITAAASSRTYSAFVKRVTGTGTVTLKSGAATLDITALINSSTFTLVQITDSTLNTTVGFQINTSADAIDVDCNQFESGAFATTPIPAAGTRNADMLTYPLTGNISNTAGTAYAERSFVAQGTLTTDISIGSGGGAAGQLLTFASANAMRTFDGTNNNILNNGPFSNQVVFKAAVSWNTTINGTTNGSAVGTGAFDGDMGFTASIGIMTYGAANASTGTIKNIRLWQRQLPDAMLQTLTT